jgi:hypothetical protein
MVRMDHLNDLECQSIMKIYEAYNNIFPVPGGKLSNHHHRMCDSNTRYTSVFRHCIFSGNNACQKLWKEN